ncbi:MAG: hypothetical protein QXD23_02460 [Candidatus Micrarchaeaceae archaeon]
MKIYDLICMESLNTELNKRLGFSGVLSNNEVDIFEKIPNSKKRYIFLSNDENQIKKAIRDEFCIGICFKDNLVIKKSLEQIKDYEKIVFISVSELILTKKTELPKILYKIRSVLKYAHIYKAEIAVVTFAKEPWQLLSAAQLYIISEFIYSDEKIAKGTVSSLGRFFE